MRWLRDAGWVVALGVVIAVLVLRPERKKPPDPSVSQAAIEKMRAEFEESRVRREEELERDLSKIRTEGTQSQLRLVGKAYRRHLAAKKVPPQEEDFQNVLDIWLSHRDGEPFVILWGVDLTRLPEGGAGLLLAWEQTADKDGARCVLMADGTTTKVISDDEFNKLPRAK
ncbi:MAG TPA: hypothetical protein VH643_30155 [Gemmataceae bacterium]|jgi:hypothetical protein